MAQNCKVILKTYLSFFNIFLCLMAVVILAGVGYLIYSTNQYHGVTVDKKILVYTVIPLVALILVAGSLLTLSLIGCISCYRDLTSLIFIYAVLLSVVIVAQVGGGILAFVFKDDVSNELRNGFLNNINEYGSNQAYTSAIDAIQTELKCCGVNSYTDWLQAEIVTPQSCCRNPNLCISILPTNIYTEGCVDRLSDVVTQSAAVFISVAVLFALIQITGVVAACILGSYKRAPVNVEIQTMKEF